MYYTIYKITNKITEQIYIGQHQTEKLNDGYLGSGQRLANSVNKYGVENFDKEILFIFDNFDDMNNKEIELVTKDFIKREDVLNLIPGGSKYSGDFGGFVIAAIKGSDNFSRITSEEFYANKDLYAGVNTGKVYVICKTTGEKLCIDCSDYDRSLYKTASSDTITVYKLDNGETMQISKEDFDSKKHKSVLGGIVAEIDGKRQYVSREKFDDLNLSGVHKGKVTVSVKSTGQIKHVDLTEFNVNRHLYLHNTEGFVTGRHKITNEKRRFPKNEAQLFKNEYKFSTTGYVTVFDILENKFRNVLSEDIDYTIHKLSVYKKFIWYDKDDNIITEYWGDKQGFLNKFNVTESLWKFVLSGKTVNFKASKLTVYNGSYFKIIDWRNNVSR